MSFVQADATGKSSGFEPRTGPEADVSFDQIADGLHALAQPLSGLRSAVELINLLPAGEDGRYRKICATEVERACGLFSCLQKLIAITAADPKITCFDCRKLVHTLIVELGLSARVGGGLFRDLAPKDGMVIGDFYRTQEAFSSLFAVLTGFSGEQGTMEAACTRENDSLSFTFSASSGNGQRISSADRLHLSLVRASIVSQKGQYRMKTDPLVISLSLPRGEAQQMND